MALKIPYMLARYVGYRSQSTVAARWTNYQQDPRFGMCFRMKHKKNNEEHWLPAAPELQAFLASIKVRTTDGHIALKRNGKPWENEEQLQKRSSNFLTGLARKGLVGKIERNGPGGSHVLLVTDREFRAVGDFRRLERDAATGAARYVSTGTTPPLVKGSGDSEGTMTVVNVPLKETTEGEHPVKVGDLVVLADPEWELASGQWLGQVDAIGQQADAPLFARITVKPMLNLAALREVQVMNKVPRDAQTAGSVVQSK